MTKGDNSSSEKNDDACNIGYASLTKESFHLVDPKVKETNLLEDMISKLTINDMNSSAIVKDFENIKIKKYMITEISNTDSDNQNYPETPNDVHSEYSETDSENYSLSDDEKDLTFSINKIDVLSQNIDGDVNYESSSDNEDKGGVILKERNEHNEQVTIQEDNNEHVISEKINKDNEQATIKKSNEDNVHAIKKEGNEDENIVHASVRENYEDEDNSEKEEEEKYLKRGLLTHNKVGHRFSPIHHVAASSSHAFNRNHGKLANNQNSQETISNVFDIIDFQNDAPKENLSSQFQLWQNEQFDSRNASLGFSNELEQPSYFANNDFNLLQNNNYQEVQSNDWNTMSPVFYPDNVYDYSNSPLYQPPTPPKSVSPMLRETSEGYLQNSPIDNYNDVKKSEDLINIINAINLANKTEPTGIPEAELEKLRSVLESNDDSIRNEMDMYLAKDDSLFQKDIMSSFNTQPTNILEEVQDDCNYWFDGEPLTPPSSIPPAQDGCSSPAWEQDDTVQLCSEEHLSDIISGIDEINPEELNIYLEKEKQSIYDTSYAKTWLQKKCKPNALDHAFRRLSQTSNKVMCKKDKDGDTGLMIVFSQPENSPDFTENVFCMQEIVREIKVCCDVPLGKAKRCKSCGNTDSSKFYTPLSFKNNQGYSALCCAVKTNLSPVIVDFLLDGILQNEEDVRRVFDDAGKRIFAEVCHYYPSLNRYI